jgi:hypothetical protein
LEVIVTTLQTEWTEQELLASHPVVEPLVAGGVRCHGGFDGGGAYVSPRTLNRWPAIDAWKQQREEQFGGQLLDVNLGSWPGTYPNVAQAKCLIAAGVPEPIIATLTRIGTVEGFGAMIRYSVLPDFQSCFEEDARGTALAHLGGGLFEAHARDEAGWEEEGGHKQMWYAARDVAFEDPVTEDQTALMLERMGIPTQGGTPDAEAIRRQLMSRLLFEDVDANLQFLIDRMANLLLIEVSAYHTFAWAEEVLSDTELVAGEGQAARLVSYVRADEAPHVEYLKTVLSEMRDRTFRTESGRRIPGSEVIGAHWERSLAESLGVRREQNLAITLREVEHALDGHPRRRDLLEQFHALGSIRPGPDGSWVKNAA